MTGQNMTKKNDCKIESKGTRAYDFSKPQKVYTIVSHLSLSLFSLSSMSKPLLFRVASDSKNEDISILGARPLDELDIVLDTSRDAVFHCQPFPPTRPTKRATHSQTQSQSQSTYSISSPLTHPASNVTSELAQIHSRLSAKRASQRKSIVEHRRSLVGVANVLPMVSSGASPLEIVEFEYERQRSSSAVPAVVQTLRQLHAPWKQILHRYAAFAEPGPMPVNDKAFNADHMTPNVRQRRSFLEVFRGLVPDDDSIMTPPSSPDIDESLDPPEFRQRDRVPTSEACSVNDSGSSDDEEDEQASTPTRQSDAKQPDNSQSATLINNAPLDSDSRPGIMRVYHPTFKWAGGASSKLCHRRNIDAPTQEKTVFRMLVDVLTLGFHIGNLEPFFCELALFDVVEKRRVSEGFHFHLNSNQSMEIIKQHVVVRQFQDRCHRAMFSLTENTKSSNVCLILLVHRVLQGDLRNSYDSYGKYNTLSARDNTNLRSRIQRSCKQLGKYRQLFVWSASRIFDENGQCDDKTIAFNGLHRQPKNTEPMDTSQLCDCAVELIENRPKRSFKSVPGSCLIQVRLLSNERYDAVMEAQGRVFSSTLRPLNAAAVDASRGRHPENVGAMDQAVLKFGGVTEVHITEDEKSDDAIVQQTESLNQRLDTLNQREAERSTPSADGKDNTDTSSSSGAAKPKPKYRPRTRSKSSIIPSREEQLSYGAAHRAADDSSTISPLAGKKGGVVQIPRALLELPPERSDMTLELANFPSEPEVSMACDYRNTLYVYPQSVAFADSRNICVRMTLKDSDADLEGEGLPFLYGHSDGMAAESELHSSVTYHCYNTSFLDEFKVELPSNLRPCHHLLFTFLNIQCKDIGPDADAAAPIGYAILPLLQDGRVADELQMLMVHRKLPKQQYFPALYESKNVGKSPFTVRLMLRSTLYSNDPYISKFLRDAPALIHVRDSQRRRGPTILQNLEARRRALTGKPPALVTATGGGGMSRVRQLAAKINAGKLEPVNETDKRKRDNSPPTPTRRRLVAQGAARNNIFRRGGMKRKPKNGTLKRNQIVGVNTRSARDQTGISRRFQRRDSARLAAIMQRQLVDKAASNDADARQSNTSSSSSSNNNNNSSNNNVGMPAVDEKDAGSSITAIPAATRSAVHSREKSRDVMLSMPSFGIDEVAGPNTTTSSPTPLIVETMDMDEFDAMMPSSEPVVVNEEDERAAEIIRQVIRSGYLNRKGGLTAFKARWFVLTTSELLCYKDMRMNKLEFKRFITPETLTDVAESAQGMAFTVSDDGDNESAPSQSSGSRRLSTLTSPRYRSAGNHSSNSNSTTSTLTGNDASAESKAAEMVTCHVDSPEDMFAWIKAITHVQIRDLHPTDSLLGLRAAQPELVIQFFPTILRLLMAIICAPANNIQLTAFHALLVTLDAVERAASRGGERCVVLDMCLRYIFDDYQKDEYVFGKRPAAGSGDASSTSAGPSGSDNVVSDEKVRCAYEQIIQYWLTLLHSRDETDDEYKSLAAHFSWFLFDMVIKSMVLHIARVERRRSGARAKFPKASRRNAYHDYFSRGFFSVLTSFVRKLTSSIQENKHKVSLSKRLNRNLGLFLRDLLSLLDRTYVFDLIGVYLMQVMRDEKATLMENKYAVMQIITDHEHYLHLAKAHPIVGEARNYIKEVRSASNGSLPIGGRLPLLRRLGSSSSSIASTDSRQSSIVRPALMLRPMQVLYPTHELYEDGVSDDYTLVRELTEFCAPEPPQSGHFLPLCMFMEVARGLRHHEREIITAKAAVMLRSLLSKHDYDSRYSSPQQRSAIASMYLPLLPYLWQDLQSVASLRSSSCRRDLLVCVLFVLKNVKHEHLREFLRTQVTQAMTGGDAEAGKDISPIITVAQCSTLLADTLHLILDSFEFPGSHEMTRNTSKTILCPSTEFDRSHVVGIDGKKTSGGSDAEQVSTMFAKLESKYADLDKSVSIREMRQKQLGSMRQMRKQVKVQSYNSIRRGKNQQSPASEDVLFQWERALTNEVGHIVLDTALEVLIPLVEPHLETSNFLNDQVMWLLHHVLTVYQSDEVVCRLFGSCRFLLNRHSRTIWRLSAKPRDPVRCSRWWFQLLRHACYMDVKVAEQLHELVYEIFSSLFTSVGSLSRVTAAMVEAFVDVFDVIRPPGHLSVDFDATHQLNLPSERSGNYDAKMNVAKAAAAMTKSSDVTLQHSMNRDGTPESGNTTGDVDPSADSGSATPRRDAAAVSGTGAGAGVGAGAGAGTSDSDPSSSSSALSASQRYATARPASSASSSKSSLSTSRSHASTLRSSTKSTSSSSSNNNNNTGSSSGSKHETSSRKHKSGPLRLDRTDYGWTSGLAYKRFVQRHGRGAQDAKDAESNIARTLTSMYSDITDSDQIGISLSPNVSTDAASTAINTDYLDLGPITEDNSERLAHRLESFLRMLSQRAKNEVARYTGTSSRRLPCAMQIVHTSDKLVHAMLTSAMISSREFDIDTVAEFCLQMVLRFDESPRMQVHYLAIMRNAQIEQGCFAEAASCSVRIANIVRDRSLNSMVESECLTTPYWIKTMQDASRLYELAAMYERTVEMEQALMQHFSAVKNLRAVVECQERILNAHRRLLEHERDTLWDRVGTFYRVKFWGTSFGHLHDREYVYRCARYTTLSDICSELTIVYSHVTNGKIEIISSDVDIESKQKDANIGYVQVTAVKYEHNGTVFTFDTRMESGKRRTSLYPRFRFPFVLRRVPVHRRRVQHINKIRASMDDIDKRVLRLEEEIEMQSLKTLNQVLSGSVNMQVHGGVEEVVKEFLHPPLSAEFSDEEYTSLRQLVSHFLVICDEALQVGRSLCRDDADRAFQELLESGYASLIEAVTPYL
jgi:C2 domain in Dock180 and Zizimin proteins/DHR-2, Lobe C